MAKNVSLERALGMMGSLARDVVTGFTGRVVGVTEYSYGCTHITIDPESLSTNNTRIKGISFDEPRVEIVEKRPLPQTVIHPTIKVGYIVKDMVNGQQGCVGGITTWLYGTPDLAVEPTELSPDGSTDAVFYLPESRAEVIEISAPKYAKDPDEKPKTTQGSKRTPGGPRLPAPDRRRAY